MSHNTETKYKTRTNEYNSTQESSKIFGELIKIYCYCQKRDDNAFKRTHRLSILSVLFFFLIRHIYTFLLLPPISNVFVHIFFSSSFAYNRELIFIYSTCRRKWVAKKMCFFVLFANAEYFPLAVCAVYNFIRWNIIIFCSTPRRSNRCGRFLCAWMCIVNYLMVIIARFHLEEGCLMAHMNPWMCLNFRIHRRLISNLNGMPPRYKLEKKKRKECDFVMNIYLNKSLAIPMLLLFSCFYFQRCCKVICIYYKMCFF